MLKQLIHLMADGSFCPTLKIATGGFCVKSDLGHLRASRTLVEAHDAFAAELYAVAEGLRIAKLCGYLTENSTLLIRSDNQGVINYLNGGRVSRKDLIPVLAEIFMIGKEFNLQIKSQHIKGHSKKTEAKYKVQRGCHNLAKRHMDHARGLVV